MGGTHCFSVPSLDRVKKKSIPVTNRSRGIEECKAIGKMQFLKQFFFSYGNPGNDFDTFSFGGAPINILMSIHFVSNNTFFTGEPFKC